jgi:hypothetical protein
MDDKKERHAGTPTPGQEPGDRRAALKKLLAAGGVVTASHWSKPVVDAVILPAHAQSTVFAPPAGFTGSGSVSFTVI